MATVSTILQMRDQMSQALRGPTEALRRMRQQADQVTQRLRTLGSLAIRPVIALRDLASKAIQALRGSLTRLGNRITTVRIAARDAATRVVTALRATLTRLNSATTSIRVAVRDFATNKLKALGLKALALARTPILLAIKARDMASSVITAIRIKLFPLAGVPNMIRIAVRDAATSAILKIRMSLTRLSHMSAVARVAIRDAATTVIQKIRIGMTRLSHATATVRVIVRDLATRAINRTITAAKALNNYVIKPVIKITATAAMATINGVRSGLAWLRAQSPTIAVFLRDAATTGLKAIGKIAQRLGTLAVHVTVKVRDAATATLKGIQRVAKATSGILGKIGAMTGLSGALSGGTILAQGYGAAKSDALIAAQTGQYGGNVTSAIDNIYYNHKAGSAERETVANLYGAVASQTDSKGAQLERQAAIAARYQALDPEADPTEVARAFTASYNSGFGDFGQTGDALAYIRRNGGDQYKDLLDTFNEYATSANRAGVSTDQLAGGLVSYQKSGGRNYDNPADAMREWGIRAVTTVDKNAVDALTELVGKKQTQQMYKEMKKGFKEGRGSEAAFDFLSTQVEALNKLDNPMKRQILQAKLYGSQFEDNDKAMQSFFEGMITGVDTTGELAKAYQQLKDSDPTVAMTEAWLKFKKTTKDVGLEVMKALGPTFEDLSAWLGSDEGQKGLKDFADTMKELGTSIGKDLVGGLKWVVANWDDIKSFFSGDVVDSNGNLTTRLTPWMVMVTIFKSLKAATEALGEAFKETFKPLWALESMLNLFQKSGDAFTLGNVVNWLYNATEATSPLTFALKQALGFLDQLMNKGQDAQDSMLNTEAAVRRMGNAVTENTPLMTAVVSGSPPKKSFTDTLAANNPNLYPRGIPQNQNKQSGFAAGMWKVPKQMEVTVHPEETILPAKDARKFRSALSSQGSKSNQVSSARPEINMPVHIGSISNGMELDHVLNAIGEKLSTAIQISTKGGAAIEGQ